MASRAEYASSRGLWENLLCLKAGLHLLCTYAQNAKRKAQRGHCGSGDLAALIDNAQSSGRSVPSR